MKGVFTQAMLDHLPNPKSVGQLLHGFLADLVGEPLGIVVASLDELEEWVQVLKGRLA